MPPHALQEAFQAPYNRSSPEGPLWLDAFAPNANTSRSSSSAESDTEVDGLIISSRTPFVDERVGVGTSMEGSRTDYSASCGTYYTTGLLVSVKPAPPPKPKPGAWLPEEEEQLIGFVEKHKGDNLAPVGEIDNLWFDLERQVRACEGLFLWRRGAKDERGGVAREESRDEGSVVRGRVYATSTCMAKGLLRTQRCTPANPYHVTSRFLSQWKVSVMPRTAIAMYNKHCKVRTATVRSERRGLARGAKQIPRPEERIDVHRRHLLLISPFFTRR